MRLFVFLCHSFICSSHRNQKWCGPFRGVAAILNTRFLRAIRIVHDTDLLSRLLIARSRTSSTPFVHSSLACNFCHLCLRRNALRQFRLGPRPFQHQRPASANRKPGDQGFGQRPPMVPAEVLGSQLNTVHLRPGARLRTREIFQLHSLVFQQFVNLF